MLGTSSAVLTILAGKYSARLRQKAILCKVPKEQMPSSKENGLAEWRNVIWLIWFEEDAGLLDW